MREEGAASGAKIEKNREKQGADVEVVDEGKLAWDDGRYQSLPWRKLLRCKGISPGNLRRACRVLKSDAKGGEHNSDM